MTGKTNTIAAALRLLADAIEAQEAKDADPGPEWYDSANYPHGPKAFRRHIARGMRAIKAGKGYRVRRDDAEAFWESTLRRKPAPALRPLADDSEAAMRARLERAGIRLGAQAA